MFSYARDVPEFIRMAQDAVIAREWPLHWMVWNNDVIALTSALKEVRSVSNELYCFIVSWSRSSNIY